MQLWTQFWTKFSPNDTICSVIFHSLFHKFCPSEHIFDEPQMLHFFQYQSHKSGWFVTLFISHKFHRTVLVNFGSIDLFQLWTKFFTTQILFEANFGALNERWCWMNLLWRGVSCKTEVGDCVQTPGGRQKNNLNENFFVIVQIV